MKISANSGRGKQDWRIFVTGGILGAFVFLFLGGSLFLQCINEGFDQNTIILIIMSVVFASVLVLGAVWGVKTFQNFNEGKRDESIQVQYMMNVGGQICLLTDLDMLRRELLRDPNGENVIITLAPEYFGLKEWTFARKGGYYISFIKIQKKDKVKQYFARYTSNVDYAINLFAEVFTKKNAVDTTEITSIKFCKYDFGQNK